MEYIDKLEIDIDLKWTPCRSKNGVLKYPDHYALLLAFKDIPMFKAKPIPCKKEIVWNTKKKEGWKKFKEKTENNKMLIKASQSESSDPERVLKSIEKELNKVKYASFGKVKKYSKPKLSRKLDKLQSNKINIANNKNEANKEAKIEEINKEIGVVMNKMETKQLEKDVIQLQNLKRSKCKAAETFKLRDKLLRQRKLNKNR